MKSWDGTDLEGQWRITYKIDGVQAISDGKGNVVSRANKPLYNLSWLQFGTYEIYRDNWETSVSLVRSKEAKEIYAKDTYRLDVLDPRLHIGSYFNPSASRIMAIMADAVDNGYEGLVLHGLGGPLKVKPKASYDVQVTGVIPGKGKYEGMLGAFTTDLGNVGTGFTDTERRQLLHFVPDVIEVECMGLTPAGKFRHPRFIRVRFDKSA